MYGMDDEIEEEEEVVYAAESGIEEFVEGPEIEFEEEEQNVAEAQEEEYFEERQIPVSRSPFVIRQPMTSSYRIRDPAVDPPRSPTPPPKPEPVEKRPVTLRQAPVVIRMKDGKAAKFKLIAIDTSGVQKTSENRHRSIAIFDPKAILTSIDRAKNFEEEEEEEEVETPPPPPPEKPTGAQKRKSSIMEGASKRKSNPKEPHSLEAEPLAKLPKLQPGGGASYHIISLDDSSDEDVPVPQPKPKKQRLSRGDLSLEEFELVHGEEGWTEDYKKKRFFNNISVRASREKRRNYIKAMLEEERLLEARNDRLNGQIRNMETEVRDLKRQIQTSGLDLDYDSLQTSEKFEKKRPSVEVTEEWRNRDKEEQTEGSQYPFCCRACRNAIGPDACEPRFFEQDVGISREVLATMDSSVQKEHRFLCPVCKIIFRHFKSWQQHLTKMHKNYLMLHTCPLCDESFYSDEMLEDHRQRCAPSMRDHKAEQEEERQKMHREVTCPWCSFKGKKSSVLAHVRIKHTTKRGRRGRPRRQQPEEVSMMWYCDICSSFFWSKQALIQHKHQVHTAGKATAEQEEAKDEEERSESPVAPEYQCDQCTKGFQTSYGLRAHLRQMHLEKETSLACKECGLVAESEAELSEHKAKEHQVILTCAKCSGFFTTSQANLAEHEEDCPGKQKARRMKSRGSMEEEEEEEEVEMRLGFGKYKCNFCARKYSSKDILDEHKARIHVYETRSRNK